MNLKKVGFVISFQNVLLIENTEPLVSKAKYLLEHAYGVLLVPPLLLSARPSPVSAVPTEDPYIVAMVLPRPSISLSAKVTEE